MKKKSKIIIFLVLLLFGGYKILNNEGIMGNDNVYVVSKEEDKGYEEDKYRTYKELDKNETQNEDETLIDESTIKEVAIFISGEVKNPGVIEVENGTRLHDAIDKVGGVTDEADLNRVNLAIKVQDEQHYVIPKIGEEIDLNSSAGNTTTPKLDDKVSSVNINTATIEELDTLPGVGEATANKIVNYRDENGKFNSIEEIKNVNGIGDKKYEEIKELIDIN